MIKIKNITDTLKHLDGLKALIFDLDDTLYSEKEYVKSGYHAVSQVIPQVILAEQKLWMAFENKKPAINEVLQADNIYTDDLKHKCLNAYRNHSPNIHFYDGVAQMLGFLRNNGYLIGVITDGRPEGQRAKIKALQLEKYTDYIIVTDELGGIEYRKPNKTAFTLMKEKFNINFCEMCYVGDNINKDFIAPEALGMRSIWFQNPDGLYFEN